MIATIKDFFVISGWVCCGIGVGVLLLGVFKSSLKIKVDGLVFLQLGQILIWVGQQL